MTLPHVHLSYLPDPPFVVRKLPFVLGAPIKIIWQSISVLVLLLRVKAEVILVQVSPRQCESPWSSLHLLINLDLSS